MLGLSVIDEGNIPDHETEDVVIKTHKPLLIAAKVKFANRIDDKVKPGEEESERSLYVSSAEDYDMNLPCNMSESAI